VWDKNPQIEKLIKNLVLHFFFWFDLVCKRYAKDKKAKGKAQTTHAKYGKQENDQLRSPHTRK
jgi:hypothetical protein